MDELPPDSDQTRDLLERAGAGDRGALDRLVARHRAALRQVVARRLDPALRGHELVARLPEADREILFMRTVEELSYPEAAHILGIDPAAARKRHGRALLRLHKLLADGGLTESQL